MPDMCYKFRHTQYDRPGMGELFVLRFNVYGAEGMLRQLTKRKRLPRRTKHPAQPIAFQSRYYERDY